MKLDCEEQSAPQLAALLATSDLFGGLDRSIIHDVADEMQRVKLPDGMALFRQGDPGDCMYVVVRGQLVVRIDLPDGRQQVLNLITAGQSVGEMALLTGQQRVASAYATEATDLVRLSRAGFDHLVAKHPQAMLRFAQTILPRLRRTQIVDVLHDLFGDLSPDALHDIEARLQWQHLPSGAILFQQGDPADSLSIVVSGRLRVTVRDRDGSERTVTELGRFEVVGELALLSDETRASTVYAIRDTDVVTLSKQAFDTLIEQYPGALRQISRRIVGQLREAVAARPHSSASTSFALVPAAPDVPLHAFAERLQEALTATGSTLYLNSARFDRLVGKPGAAQTREDDPTDLALRGWLSTQEARHSFLIYEAEAHESSWTSRCLRQADCIVIVASAAGDPQPGPLERRNLAARKELVLLHDVGGAQASGTLRWLTPRRIDGYHHVRLSVAADVQRLARRLTGQAFGLVLSGGGARGFAHTGVIRAVEEAGIPIDIVGGTSIGAVVAAMYARGMDWQEMLRVGEALVRGRRLRDYTFPAIAFFRSRGVTDALMTLFGDTLIEDLWLPFFCVSSNLNNAQNVIHRQGPLWKYVRASTAIPGVFSPILDHDAVLVDGGVSNPVPTDIMRALCGNGTVIASNVNKEFALGHSYKFDDSISGWHVLLEKLPRRRKRVIAPSLIEIMLRVIEFNSVPYLQSNFRLADILIEPPVERFGTLDFRAMHAIAEAGYRCAQQQIALWQASR